MTQLWSAEGGPRRDLFALKSIKRVFGIIADFDIMSTNRF